MIHLFKPTTTKNELIENNGDFILDHITKSAKITEELNGNYTLDLTLIIDKSFDSKCYDLISESSIIKIDDENGYEYFRIASVIKNKNYIDVFARHITISDILTMWLEDVRPENKNGNDALNWIFNNATTSNIFTVKSDIADRNTAYYVNKNVYEALFTADNSFLERWGGEIKRTGFTIEINKSVGRNNGVSIKSRKNLIGFEASTNINELTTRIYPKGFDGITINEKYIDSEYINAYPQIHSRVVEFEDVRVNDENYNEGFNTLEEAQAELKRRSELLFTRDKNDIIKATYKIDFVQLEKTEEYKNFAVIETTNLGDIVNVYDETLNVDIDVRVISRVYDCIKKERTSTTLSNKSIITKPASITSIIQQLEKIPSTDSILSDAKKLASTLLKQGNKDSYVVVKENEILIMDTKDVNTAKKVWRFNNNGLGFSNTGYYGEYGFAMTMDGSIVADFITTGVLNGALIKANSINADSLSIGLKKQINSPTGAFNRVFNSCFKNGLNYWDIVGTPTTQFKKYNNGYDSTLLMTTTENNQYVYQYFDDLQIGKTYTVSVFVYGIANSFGLQIQHNNVKQNVLANETNTWHTLSITFTAVVPTLQIQLGRGDFGTNGTHMFTAVQLKEGDKVSLYSPYPSEIYENITTIDRNGVVVDCTEANTKAQMKADGFKIIRKSDNKELFNASNGNLTIEGTFKTSSTGKHIEASGQNYKVYDGSTQKIFLGLASNDVWTNVPKLYMGTRGVGDSYEFTGYDYFSLQAYEDSKNPQSYPTAYMDMAYYNVNRNDYSNIKMFGDGDIRIAPIKDLEIRSNHVSGNYGGTSENLVAKFTTSTHSLYNGNLQIGSIQNTTNNNGLILGHWRESNGVHTLVRVHSDNEGNKLFRPCDGNADIYLGSSSYKWKVVHASNGTIQTSDERYKMKMGYLDTNDCYEMVKNTDLYKYCMLPKSKEEMSETEIRKIAKTSSTEDVAIQTGIMAQDILDYSCSKYVLTHDTWLDEDTNEKKEMYNINPYGFSTAIMGALKKEIEIREKQYNELKKENELLKEELNKIEELLNK